MLSHRVIFRWFKLFNWIWFLGLFLGFPQIIYASVVINEFLVEPVEPEKEQWVELYNSGEEDIDISGWIIDDGGSLKENYPISNNTVIKSKKFLFFSSSYFNLNPKTPDSLRLLQGEVVVDSYPYAKSPGVGYSFGREKDGEGTWVVFYPPSKGESNNQSQVVPTETPQPPPTEKPTTTPKPTNTPRPTSTPKPTSKPKPSSTPSPTKTPTPTKVPSPTKIPPTNTSSPSTKTVGSSENLGGDTIVLAKKTLGSFVTSAPPLQEAVLGEVTQSGQTSGKKRSSSPSQAEKPTKTLAALSNKTNTIVPLVFFTLGAVSLTACGILAFYLYKRRE